MSIFKKFFEKKKLDSKFKKAGEGHKLATSSQAASSSGSSSSSSHPKAVPSRTSPSDGARKAGMAALHRVENQNAPTMVNRSQNVIRAEARKELEAESQLRNKEKTPLPPPSKEAEGAKSDPISSVFFTCPIIGPDVLSKEEMDVKIREFLYEQLDEEPALISCLIIRTCNKDKDKIVTCVETLVKCLNNVLEHPDEEKYRKLRVNNKAFQDKVVSIEGSLDFLRAAGFESQMLGETDDTKEEFYILESYDGATNREHLEMIRDALISCEAIRPDLDRNVKVLIPCQQLEKVDLPADFYRLSLDELKREQQHRAELVEKTQMLRTKAMRERDAARERRLYRFCFIRTRFPDGLMLQGTFKTWEKLRDVRTFIGEHLDVAVRTSTSYRLTTVNGQLLTEDDDDNTLADLGLIPAVVINLSLDSPNAAAGGYLKPETLALCTE